MSICMSKGQTLERILLSAVFIFLGCGRPEFSQVQESLGDDGIIGGTRIDRRSSDASRSVVMVELLNNDDQRLGFCTGTLIENNIVLTAAHCFDLRRIPSLRKFNILFVNALKERSPAVIRRGVAYSLHGGFNSQGHLEADIAVLLFQHSPPAGFKPVHYDQDRNANYSSHALYVYGYGRTEDYTGLPAQDDAYSQGVLHRGLMVVDIDYNRFTDRYLTHMSSESNLCQGDSGGPQFYHDKGVLKMVGVNSGVIGRKLPNGRYSCKGQGQATKVAHFAPWIAKEIKALKKKYWYGVAAENETAMF